MMAVAGLRPAHHDERGYACGGGGMGFGQIVGCAAAIVGGLGVAAGAYAAHGLAGEPRAAALLGTASQYAVWHALATFVALSRPRLARTTAGFFLLGALLFAGSVAILAFGGPAGFGILAPVGGLTLITGWLVLAVSFLR